MVKSGAAPIESSRLHERNTDHGTHTIIANILNQGFVPRDPRSYASGEALTAPLNTIGEILLPALKTQAEERAREVAARAIARVQECGRWSDSTTLAHAFAEVFFDPQIRRGPAPSPAGRRERSDIIKGALERGGDLRFAVLILPRRDTNPAKNDGPSPDMGEVSTLLRLWTIGRSMELVRESFVSPRISVIEASAGTPSMSVAAAREFFHSALQRDAARSINQVAGLEVIAQAMSEARSRKEPITRSLLALGGELAAYQVLDKERACALLLRLARSGKTLEWIESGLKYADMGRIEVLAIQDSRRYACCRTDPLPNVTHYGDLLNELATRLSIGDHVTLTSHEQLESMQDPARLAKFLARRSEVFHEKLHEFLTPFEQVEEFILAAKSREEVLQIISDADPSGKIAPLFEAILHTRYHPNLEEWTKGIGEDSRAFRLQFINQIYESQAIPELEALRRDVLWASVVGAAEYVASYDSNSAAANKYGLDDVEFLVPGSIRLSIHKKVEDCRQFTIQPGPSIHRTPWHGTAALRQSRNGTGLSLDCRLGLELKHEGYVPLLLSKHSETRNDSRTTGPLCRVTNRDEWLRFGSLLYTAQTEQPIVWLSAELVAALREKGYKNGAEIVAALASQEIKF